MYLAFSNSWSDFLSWSRNCEISSSISCCARSFCDNVSVRAAFSTEAESSLFCVTSQRDLISTSSSLTLPLFAASWCLTTSSSRSASTCRSRPSSSSRSCVNSDIATLLTDFNSSRDSIFASCFLYFFICLASFFFSLSDSSKWARNGWSKLRASFKEWFRIDSVSVFLTNVSRMTSNSISISWVRCVCISNSFVLCVRSPYSSAASGWLPRRRRTSRSR
mmetsp:Transcript_16699/g.24757  ORF Transcript_16699/g.24757 Transcript_16699/m.24757 type:complete len:220 (+) Transcript_16699:1213-1872(+)